MPKLRKFAFFGFYYTFVQTDSDGFHSMKTEVK